MADVLVFGANSLVGSHFVAHGRCTVVAAGRTDPRDTGLKVERFCSVNLANRMALSRIIREASEPVIINFAARTDVDGMERERPPPGALPVGDGWEVNALAPEAIARATSDSGKHLIQVSTDFVFDGHAGPYSEVETPSPLTSAVSWYGWCKGEGERRVMAIYPRVGIVRISLPFRVDYPLKLDFARGILRRFRDGSLTGLYTDQQITPTWIPDVTDVLSVMVARQGGGVIHVASPAVTTPYEFGTELIREAGYDPSQVPRSTLASVHAPDRAPRPLQGGLRTGTATDLGVTLTSWKEGIRRFVASEVGRR